MWQRQAVRHGSKFIRHIVPAIVKPLHSLWNEVVGFFFLCFSMFFGIRTFTYYRQYAVAPPALVTGEFMRVVTTGFFALIFAWFGISSFLRARRISRS